MTPLDVILEGLRKSEPVGIDKFDSHEEKKLREKEKARKEEVYLFLRPVVDVKGRGYRFVPQRDVIRMGSGEKEEGKEVKGKQSKREKIEAKILMVARSNDVQGNDGE